MNVETKINQTVHDPDDLFLGRVFFHHDDHKIDGEWGVGSGEWGAISHSPLPIPHSLLFTPFLLARLDAFDSPSLVNHALE